MYGLTPNSASGVLTQIIELGWKTLGVSLEEFQRAAKSDWRKRCAELVQSQIVMWVDWIRATLKHGRSIHLLPAHPKNAKTTAKVS